MARKKSSLQDRIKKFDETHLKSVREMVKLYRSGRTFKVLGFICGMRPQAVSNILVRMGRITEEDRIEHAKNANNFKAEEIRQNSV